MYEPTSNKLYYEIISGFSHVIQWTKYENEKNFNKKTTIFTASTILIKLIFGPVPKISNNRKGPAEK